MSHPPTINATMMTKTMLMTMSCWSKIRDWLTGLAVAVNRFIMGPQLITSGPLTLQIWSSFDYQHLISRQNQSLVSYWRIICNDIRDQRQADREIHCTLWWDLDWSLNLFSWRSDYRHLQWITVDHKHPVSWFVIIIWYNTSFSQLRCVWSSDHCLIFISFKAEV